MSTRSGGTDEEECTLEMESQVRLIWPCYENENVGWAAVQRSGPGSQGLEQVCGWNGYYCAMVDGGSMYAVCAKKSEVAYLSRVLSGKEEERKKWRKKVFVGAQVRFEDGGRKRRRETVGRGEGEEGHEEKETGMAGE